MAYDRVNWEDKPSTATPINAENLNKMDSGIKDLEEGKISKSDIVQTDTINDPTKVASTSVTHALGQQVTQLNNNLAYTVYPVVDGNLQNSWAPNGYCRFAKLGKIIIAHLQIRYGVTDTGITILQVPTAFYPVQSLYISCLTLEGVPNGRLVLGTDGKLSVSSSIENNTSVIMDFSYITS